MKPLSHAQSRNLAGDGLTEVAADREDVGKFEGWLHGLALGFASVCGVHCLLTPVLLILFPIIGSTFFVDESFHLWMLLAVVPTTVIAVFLGCRRHKDKYVFLLALAGLVMITVAAVWGHGHELHSAMLDHQHGEHCEHHDHAHPGGHGSELHHHDHSKGSHSHANAEHGAHGHTHRAWATWLTVIGALLMVGSHFRNHRLCRSAHCCHDHEH